MHSFNLSLTKDRLPSEAKSLRHILCLTAVKIGCWVPVGLVSLLEKSTLMGDSTLSNVKFHGRMLKAQPAKNSTSEGIVRPQAELQCV
jgi:hypothetical protein